MMVSEFKRNHAHTKNKRKCTVSWKQVSKSIHKNSGFKKFSPRNLQERIPHNESRKRILIKMYSNKIAMFTQKWFTWGPAETICQLVSCQHLNRSWFSLSESTFKSWNRYCFIARSQSFKVGPLWFAVLTVLNLDFCECMKLLHFIWGITIFFHIRPLSLHIT